jgi:hypothetical protein
MGRGAHPRTRQRHEDKAAALDPACSSWNAGDVGRLKPLFLLLFAVLYVDSAVPDKQFVLLSHFQTVSTHDHAL